MSRDLLLRVTADEVLREQSRASELRDAGRFPHLADDHDCPDILRLAALMEELGEVARCVHDNDREGLPRELHQLAGVAIAWASIL
jgi:hypothetical protein